MITKNNFNIFSGLCPKSAKSHLELPFSLHEIIIGSMLGDLTAEKPNERCNTRLHFKQSIINKEYINHLYELFKDYCGTLPNNLSYYDKRTNKMKEYGA